MRLRGFGRTLPIIVFCVASGTARMGEHSVGERVDAAPDPRRSA